MKKKTLALVMAVVAAAGIGAFDSPGDAAEKEFLVIAGGSEIGIYYQVALGDCGRIRDRHLLSGGLGRLYTGQREAQQSGL